MCEFRATAHASVVDAALGSQQESRSKSLHCTFVFHDSFFKWLGVSLKLHLNDVLPMESVHGASQCTFHLS